MTMTRVDAKAAVGPGWERLVDIVFDNLPSDVVVLDVKEKFGGLRVAVSACSQELDTFLDTIEDLSLGLCEHCGQPGRPRDDSWIKTLCDHCRQKRSDNLDIRWKANEIRGRLRHPDVRIAGQTVNLQCEDELIVAAYWLGNSDPRMAMVSRETLDA